jgi:hypothetical protein
MFKNLYHMFDLSHHLFSGFEFIAQLDYVKTHITCLPCMDIWETKKIIGLFLSRNVMEVKI